jgi:hypothetical protein
MPGRKPLAVIPLGREGKEIGEWVFRLKKTGAYTILPKHHKLPFSSFRPRRDDAWGGGDTPAQGEKPQKIGGKRRRERMEANMGQEALELIAHYVGYRLDQASIREREVSLLKDAGYYPKIASVRQEWREALATGDGTKIVSLLQERAKLRSERRKITLPLAPARQEVREGMAFLTKVAFPETIARAGVEPIRHL